MVCRSESCVFLISLLSSRCIPCRDGLDRQIDASAATWGLSKVDPAHQQRLSQPPAITLKAKEPVTKRPKLEEKPAAASRAKRTPRAPRKPKSKPVLSEAESDDNDRKHKTPKGQMRPGPSRARKGKTVVSE